MFTKFMAVLLGSVFTLPALAETMNGNWKGSGSVETVNASGSKIMPSKRVTYSFEQTPVKVALKDCRYVFADGSVTQCSAFTAEIRNSSEVWANGQRIGSISPQKLRVGLAINGYQIAVQANFNQGKMTYLYEFRSPDGQIQRMKASLSR